MVETLPSRGLAPFRVSHLPSGFFLCLVVKLTYTEQSERVGAKGSDRFGVFNEMALMSNEKTTTEDVLLNSGR